MTVIDDYLKPLTPDKRQALERLRKIGHDTVPELAEVMSYKLPCLALNGKVVFGFAARKDGISLYPFSNIPVGELTDKLKDYKTSPGAIQIPLDNPIPEGLVKDIIAIRLAMLADKKR